VAGKSGEEQPVAHAEPGTRFAAGLHDQALSKHHVLCHHLPHRGVGCDERDETAKHRVEDLYQHRRILRHRWSEVGIGFTTRTRHAEALLTYERLRILMADELGASPSPASEAAYLEILRMR